MGVEASLTAADISLLGREGGGDGGIPKPHQLWLHGHLLHLLH